MKTLNVKLTFIEPILGTSPSSPDIYREYIASKSPNAATIEEEIAALGVDGVAEKGTTIFMRDKNGDPFLYDYYVKGFFKEACKANKKISGSISSKIKAYKQEINDLIFPEPRCIPVHFDGMIGECQRSLRAQTPQGDRVTLANSEEIPAGAWIAFWLYACAMSTNPPCASGLTMASGKDWGSGEIRGRVALSGRKSSSRDGKALGGVATAQYRYAMLRRSSARRGNGGEKQ